MEAEAIPFPREEHTPPVMKTYLVNGEEILADAPIWMEYMGDEERGQVFRSFDLCVFHVCPFLKNPEEFLRKFHLVMLLFLDIETTGLDSQTSELLELSAVRFDGDKIVATFDELVALHDENLEIPPLVQRLTGIRKEDLVGKPSIAEIRRKFLAEFLDQADIIVGHNISFDTGFLRVKGFEFGNDEIDTYPLSTIILPEEESHSLEVLTEKYELPHENAHRALADAIANLELWKLLQQKFRTNFSPKLQEEYEAVLKKSQWVGRIFFLEKPTLPEKDVSSEGALALNFSPETAASEILPEVLSITPQTKEEVVFATEVQRIFTNGEKVLWEVLSVFPHSAVRSSFSAAVQWAAESKQKLGVSFHAYEQLLLKKIAAELQQNFPELSFAEFLPATSFLCTTKWQDFLKKVEFSALETAVSLKVLREMAQGNLAAPNLKHAEWRIWSEFSGENHENCPLDCPGKLALPENLFAKHDIFLFPHKFLKNFPGENLLVFGAENANDIFSPAASRSVSSARFRSIAEKFTPEFGQKVSFWLDLLSAFLRKSADIDEFSRELHLDNKVKTSRDWQEFRQELKTWHSELENIAADSADTRILEEMQLWEEFFSPNRPENELHFCRIFPDEEIEFVAELIDLTPFVQTFLAEKRALLFLGFPFAKNKSGEFVFSFDTQLFSEKTQFVLGDIAPEQKIKVFTPQEQNSSQDNIAEVGFWVKSIALANAGNTLAVVASQKVSESLEDSLSAELKAHGIKILTPQSGGIGKIRNFFRQPGRKLLCAPAGFLERLFPLRNPSFSVVLFQKFGFDAPGNLIITARKKLWRNGFEEFLLPRSQKRFQKEVYRLLSLQKDPYVFFCFDPRLLQPGNFGNSYQAFLPKSITIQKIVPEEIPEMFK